jgi:hypothetical protein
MSAPIIQAKVHAPTAPVWQRVTAYSIGWSFILMGLVALNSFPIADTLLGTGAWIVVMSPFLMRHRNAKSAQIQAYPGRIEIRAPRSFPRTILTRSLRGAAIEHAKGKNILWLAEASSPNTPITVEADERGLRDIRKALGIRRGGFGEIRKWPDGNQLERAEMNFRAGSAAILTLWALGMVSNGGWWTRELSWPTLLMFPISLIISAVFFMKRAPIVKLEQESANVLGDDEAMRIDQLKRGEASVADWLARIDTLAATQSEAGYRGAQFSQEDLWAAVENHETASDIRAAAARLLMRISAEKSHDRVAAVLDSIHDDTERAHLRAALDSDLEVAARELESLDDEMIDRR